MIKLFGRLRNQMLKDKKISRYLAYALGEIILVVIGILLALQINNMNEKRKVKKTIHNTLRTIKTDLAVDTTMAANIIKHYEDVQVNTQKIINGGFTKDNFKDCLNCFNLATIYQPFNTQTKGYTQLKNLIDSESNEVDSLMIELTKFYEIYPPMISKSNDRMETVVLENFKKLEAYPWFVDMAQNKLTPEIIAYFTSSEDYKKMVVSHNLLAAGNHLRLTQIYKDDAIELLTLIEDRLAED